MIKAEVKNDYGFLATTKRKLENMERLNTIDLINEIEAEKVNNFNDENEKVRLQKKIIRMLRSANTLDKTALTLCYDLFIKSSKKDFNFVDLLELVRNTEKNNYDLIIEKEKIKKITYAIITKYNDCGDEFFEEFETPEKAIKMIGYSYLALTSEEKRKLEKMEVIKSVEYENGNYEDLKLYDLLVKI